MHPRLISGGILILACLSAPATMLNDTCAAKRREAPVLSASPLFLALDSADNGSGKLIETLKMRSQDLEPVFRSRGPEFRMSPQFSWRTYQPLRLPLTPQQRALGTTELKQALEASVVDWAYAEKCLALFLYDEPNIECEELLIQVLEKLPTLSIAQVRKESLFEYLIRNLANQETSSAQAVLVELITPNFGRGFKTAAKHCFEIVSPDEIEALSDFVAGHMVDCSDLDFTQATLKKALKRHPRNSPLATTVRKHYALLEKKIAGDPFPDGAVP